MPVPESGDALESLAASLARARGDHFFPVLAAHLAGVLGASEALVCEAAPNRRARTLAVWRRGESLPNYDYDLDGTPCAKVQAGEALTVEVTSAAFPGAPQDHGGYFGMPLAANDGAVLGHLAVYSERPLSLTASQRAVCDIIANRCAAELRLVHVKRERALLRGQLGQRAQGVADQAVAVRVARQHRRGRVDDDQLGLHRGHGVLDQLQIPRQGERLPGEGRRVAHEHLAEVGVHRLEGRPDRRRGVVLGLHENNSSGWPARGLARHRNRNRTAYRKTFCGLYRFATS